MPNTFTRFSQSFENDSEGYLDETNGWSGTTTEVPSGTDGIVSPDGSSHSIFAQTDADGGLTGPFTRFDGYRSLSNDQGFTTEIKIYLDPGAWADGEGFDYSVAANRQSGVHLRDFIFHVTQDTSSGDLIIGASNNTNFDPREDLELGNFGEVTEAGWYTFEHTFFEAGDGSLAVSLTVRNEDGVVIFNEVLNNPADDYSSDFGGNRYGWFTNIDVAGGIAVDDSALFTEDENPVQVFDGSTIIGTYETIEDAKTAIDNGDIAGAALEISTTGLDDAFFYVADGMSIQAAVDAAEAGDAISIAAGTFNESVDIDKVLDISGEGVGQTIVTPPSGNGFSIAGDLGTDATLSIDGIEFLDSPNGSGVFFDDDAILGTLQITNSEFEGNFRNGVAIGGNSGPVDLDNVVITDTDFVGNGGDPSSQTSSGDGDLLFYQYYGDATLTNLSITGVIVGSGPAENAIQFRGDAGSLGNVALTNVTIDGVYEKQPIAFFNYDDVLGLSSSNVDITADSTSFGISGNFDGIGGDIDFASQDIDVTGAPDPIALQGNADSQAISSGAEDAFLRGGEGDDSLDGGGGFDVGVYAGSRGDFTIAATTNASGFVTAFTGVTDNNAGDGDEGADSLSGVEALSFAGGASVLSLGQGVQLFDGSDELIGTFDTLKEAVDAASSGYTIRLGEGVHETAEQIVIDKDLTIIGSGKDLTTVEAGFDTATSGDARGWFLVTSGVTLDVTGVTFDGDGHNIWQAFRHLGSGAFDQVAFNDIEYQESGSPYQGTAIAVFGASSDVDVTNSMFMDIGRIGVLYFGAGVSGEFLNNTYVGKGDGDFLDYALDISAGASINVIGNTVTDNRGVASSDGSTSAAFLVSTFFGGGTNAYFENNNLNNNTTGIFVGFNSSDTSEVTFGPGNVIGGGVGVQAVGNVVLDNSDLIDGSVNWNAGDGNNLLRGSNQADDLSGGAGNDTLAGGAGADTLEGGEGVNNLLGSSGGDTYIIGDNESADISEFGGDANQAIEDRIIFTAIETVEDFFARRVGTGNSSMEFSNAAGTISGSVFRQFAIGETFRRIETVQFNDGSVFSIAPGFTGGAGDEIIAGTGGQDTLRGGAGNDVLFGSFQNDLLEGGDGDDYLFGGSGVDLIRGDGGADTYVVDQFQRSDVSEFRGDNDQNIVDQLFISSVTDITDVEFRRIGSFNDTLFFRSSDGTTTGSVFRHFNEAQPYRRVEEVRFADGKTYQLQTNFTGTAGNDVFVGTAGSDVIDISVTGGEDAIFTGFGDDTVVYEVGDGTVLLGDFRAGAGTFDRVDVSDFGEDFDEFSEIINAATEVGDDVVVDFGDGDVLTFANTTIAQLDESDFIFGSP